jgi:hypothetical protein
MHEKQIAHLGFIEDIIARMAANSFLLKGWSVTLLAAIFAISAKDTTSQFLMLAYFPVILFWALDGYFFQQETLYRELYGKVAVDAKLSETFTLEPTALSIQPKSLLLCAFNKTIWPVYVLLAVLILFAKFIKMQST